MLSKYWQIKKVKDFLRAFIKELAPDKINEQLLEEIIFVNLTDLVEMLNGASAPDYGIIENVNPINARTAVELYITAQYNRTNGIITKTSHGFTSNDIGRFVLIRGTDRANSLGSIFYSQIVQIVDNNNFRVYPFSDFDTSIQYLAMGKYANFYTNVYVDLTNLAYGVDKIIKLVDSINGLCIPVGDFEFQGLSTNTLKQNNVFYNQYGDKLLIYKGSNINTLGTLTLYYYRQPIKWMNDEDYIDLKDKYVNLLLAKCKNSIYEFLRLAPPEGLSNYIEQKIQAIRQITMEEAQLINARTNKD